MPDVLDIDAAAGMLAIYTSPGAGSDDAPLYNPLSNLSRVKLHSSLDYPKIVSVVTGSITLPAIPSGVRRLATTTLFAHGLSGIPWVFSKAVLSGLDLSISGTLPIPYTAATLSMPRTIALGADATNVLLHDNGIGNGSSSVATTISYTVYVTDVLL